MSELVKINAKDYGLEESKAKEISDLFQPMLDKMVELENEFNDIAARKISKEVCGEARALRLKYVRVRTGTAEIHRKLKQFYLQGGRFVDGWKNAQLMASEGIEGKLSSIERHYEILEEKRINDLQNKRVAELEKYGADFIPVNLGAMEPEVWDNYISGVELTHQAKIQAEKDAEEERKQREIEQALHRSRTLEVSPLHEFIENYEDNDWGKMDQKVYAGLLADARGKKSDYQAKQEQIRKDNERLKKEAEAKERKRLADEKKRRDAEEKLRIENDAKIASERAERERLAKELQDKKDEEERIERQKTEALESELKKGDAEKVIDLIEDLESLKTKYEFKSAGYKKMYSDVSILIDKVVTHIIGK